MSNPAKRRIYNIPVGLIVVFIWIGLGAFHSAPGAEDRDVVMGMPIFGTTLEIYWFINKMIILMIMLTPLLMKKFLKLKEAIVPLMLVYIGWHILNSFILSMRILTSLEFHTNLKSYAEISNPALAQIPPGEDQILIGVLSLIPAIFASFMFYLTYINRKYFNEE